MLSSRTLMHDDIEMLAARDMLSAPATWLPTTDVRLEHELLDRGRVLGKIVLVP